MLRHHNPKNFKNREPPKGNRETNQNNPKWNKHLLHPKTLRTSRFQMTPWKKKNQTTPWVEKETAKSNRETNSDKHKNNKKRIDKT